MHTVVAAARANGLRCMDGPYVGFKDARRARARVQDRARARASTASSASTRRSSPVVNAVVRAVRRRGRAGGGRGEGVRGGRCGGPGCRDARRPDDRRRQPSDGARHPGAPPPGALRRDRLRPLERSTAQMQATDACRLDGMTVVAVEQAVAAPFASRQLADLGARVIKIERPGAGDFARGYDAHRQRAVQPLRLAQPLEGIADARSEASRKRPTCCGSCSRAPTCSCTTSRPGAMGRLGFGSAALREAHPRLVVCEISGYGTTGPVSRQEGLRPAGAERSGPRLDHRHAGRRRRRWASRWPTFPRACTPSRASSRR